VKIIETHTVPIIDGPTRLSDYCTGIFSSTSTRKGIKKAILNKLVLINDEIGYTADFVSGGETLKLLLAEKQNHLDSALMLNVLYEDNYLAIIAKPSGVLVSGNKKWTITNALSTNLSNSPEADALVSPLPVHRLDYPTSGALLIAKTRQSLVLLSEMFQNRQIDKCYHAITIGPMSAYGQIDSDIDTKPSMTRYEKIDSLVSTKYSFLNLVALYPYTGRKHQLRIHLSSIGTPILGDKLYAKEGLISKGNGLYLHAYSIGFVHPITHTTLVIRSPLPKKFIKLFPQFDPSDD
jgi:23S rRNA pseudouridine1911/1915/1917 synthase